MTIIRPIPTIKWSIPKTIQFVRLSPGCTQKPSRPEPSHLLVTLQPNKDILDYYNHFCSCLKYHRLHHTWRPYKADNMPYHLHIIINKQKKESYLKYKAISIMAKRWNELLKNPFYCWEQPKILSPNLVMSYNKQKKKEN
jgi:hypothetical protein